MKRTTHAVAVLMVLALGLGIVEARPKVKRLDPRSVSSLTVRIESTDVQDIAAEMVDSLLATSIIDGRPTLIMGKLLNQTGDPVDTKSITDKIRTALVRSGRVRFAATDLRAAIHDENAYQAGGRVDRQTATKAGRAVGARYVIGGELSKIETRAGKIRDTYYKLTLNLVDLESQLIEWSDEKEIRKQSR